MGCCKVKARMPQFQEKLDNRCPNLSGLSPGAKTNEQVSAPAWAKANGLQIGNCIFSHFPNQFASCRPLNQSEIAPGKKTKRISPKMC